MSNTHRSENPIIGITIGDINGIGPEVILKALGDARMLGQCTPIIYGSMQVIKYYRNILKLKDWHINVITDAKDAKHKKTNLIECFEEVEVCPGEVKEEAGNASFQALERATKDLLRGGIDGIVTAPINKDNIQNDVFDFVGHTEYFTQNFDAEDSVMMMVTDSLRVALVTGHTPLKDVNKLITKERLLSKIKIVQKTLQQDFRITKPKIAVLGLNPHAGENGLIGKEEQEIIHPLLDELRQKGMIIHGCFPADGFWGMQQYKDYDAVLALYHDQGLIPFKSLAFAEGVNYTAGLSIVRTSPDHGTAYNIAGQNVADPTSMRQAIFLACDIINKRKA